MGTNADRLQELLRMVESGSVLTIHELALELRLSRSHLQHLFKGETGSRLGQYLTERKLRRAADFLLESNMSVKEIAYAVGYKHPPSFVRAFERVFRQPPGSYRQKMLTKRRIR